MAKLTAQEYVSKKGWDYKLHGSEIWTNCPGCGEGCKDGSFSIQADTGTWNCKRGTCRGVGHAGAVSGTLYQLMYALGDVEEYKRSEDGVSVRAAAKKNYELPKPVQRQDSVAPEAAEYIKSRGLDMEVVKQFKVQPIMFGQSPALAFPYYRNGVHVHTKYRVRDGKKEPWKNFQADSGCRRCLYGADLVPAKADSLIIVEGEFDAIAIKCLGMPAVSLPDGIDSVDGWVEEEFDWLQRFKTIFLAVDMDVTEQKLKKLANRLGIERVKRVVMPFKDANECLARGWVGLDLEKALNEAYDVRPPQLKHSEDFAEAYGKYRFGEDAEAKNNGTPWHLPGLNDYLLGKKPGGMTFWPGFNFAGKTTAMLQEMGDDCAAGIRCLFLCLEISAFEATDWLLQQQFKRSISGITVRDYIGTLCDSGFLTNLWWVEPQGSLKEEEMFDAIKYAVLKYGVQQVYIDNLTCVGFRKDDFNAQAEFAKSCKFKIARALGVHVHVVTHTRKAASMKNVSGDRNDMAGAKELSDLSDNVIIIRRNEEKDENKARNQPTTYIDIDKNRFGKRQGIIQLQYNYTSNRFDPYTGPPVKSNGRNGGYADAPPF